MNSDVYKYFCHLSLAINFFKNASNIYLYQMNVETLEWLLRANFLWNLSVLWRLKSCKIMKFVYNLYFFFSSRADLADTSPLPNSKWITESWRLAKSTLINSPTKLLILGLKWSASLPRHFCSSCTHRYVLFDHSEVCKKVLVYIFFVKGSNSSIWFIIFNVHVKKCK